MTLRRKMSIEGQVYGLALALFLVLKSIDLTISDLVAKVVVWDNDDLSVKYANEPKFSSLNMSGLEGGGKCTNNGFHFPQLGCLCPDGFSGEACRERERRDTSQLQLACHNNLNGNELGTCGCGYSEHSTKVMYCRIPEGYSCIVPQEYPTLSNTDVVDMFQISDGRRVIVPPPAGGCHPHLDYTLEPHPRPVIINMDRSVEGILMTSNDVSTLMQGPLEMELVIMLESSVRTSSTVNGSLGSQIILPCNYDRDVYIVFWNKGDDPLSVEHLVSLDMYSEPGKRNGGQYKTGHYNITDDFSLIIKNATMEDRGRYYCEVLDLASGDLVRGHTDVYITEHAENDSTAFPAVVTPSTSSPQCAVSPINDSLIQGDLVTLTCQSTGGSPQPQLNWTNDIGWIKYFENQATGESSTISTLSLLLAPEVDGVVFVCRLTHPGYTEPRECALPPLTFKPIKETSPIGTATVIIIGIFFFTYFIVTALLLTWCFLSRRILIKKNQEHKSNSVHSDREERPQRGEEGVIVARDPCIV